MAKIVTVYNPNIKYLRFKDMSLIRWVRMSEALADLGHEVHMAVGSPILLQALEAMNVFRQKVTNLKKVAINKIKWSDYDVVKTLFHKGFDALQKYNGSDHPFIISKLGSVVGAEDMPGIYFYGKLRQQLFNTQIAIDKTSRYVTLLSEPACRLWSDCFGKKNNLLLVPGASEQQIPLPGRTPYPERKKQKKCLFAGNIYTKKVQPEANEVLITKLNRLGKLLIPRGIQLYFLGIGDTRGIDRRYVACLGSVEYRKSWNYLYHADVGIVVAAGPFMHNNESTKLYHYLRAGLPTVSEAGFPNDSIVEASKLGFVVENGNLSLMAEKIEEACDRNWDRDYGKKYILEHHTWKNRAKIYDDLIKKIH